KDFGALPRDVLRSERASLLREGDHSTRCNAELYWVKTLLQGAGLVNKSRDRKAHRKRRPRRPIPGMLLHIDGSHHQWFQDDRCLDLLVILDDATSEIYYAQLVEDESTGTVMAALRDVIQRKGLFCALYSDRARHFFFTPKAQQRVDLRQLTQVGRAMKDLG